MLELYGPFLTLTITLMSVPPAFFATVFWSMGYMIQLRLAGVNFELPEWLSDVTIDEEKMKRAKTYQVYIWKGVAWIINFSWILFLLSEPGCRRWIEEDCVPFYSNAAFYNIALLDIGGIIVELTLFFIFTGYFRWAIVRKKHG